MTDLMLEMLVYLAVAALLGLLMGYLFWGWGQANRISTARAEGAAGARTSVDGDTALRERLKACGEERDLLEEKVEELRAKLRARSPGDGEGQSAGLFAKTNRPVGAPDESTGPETGLAETAATFAMPATDQVETAHEAPASLLTERPEVVDDLKEIKGVGKVVEGVLNAKGIYQFRQVANFSAQDVAWVNEAIEAFPGRIERDKWVDQAQELFRAKYGHAHTDPET